MYRFGSGMFLVNSFIYIIQTMAAAIGATLMKTGQTTSYRTGDDGDIEAGRDVDFLTLAANNPFGNTNRFTDELGGQTYTNDIVIDWSTYNGSNVLGYYIGDPNTVRIWNAYIDWALSLSVGIFISGWRPANVNELNNICNRNQSLVTVTAYAPFNYTAGTRFWSSTTARNNTSQALNIQNNEGSIVAESKLSIAPKSYAVRTFTVTGTTLS